MSDFNFEKFSIKDFMNEVEPVSKIALLERFSADILELKQAGYSNLQINDYLQRKGLIVATETLRRFIVKKTQSPTSNVFKELNQSIPASGFEDSNLKQSLQKGEELAKKYIGDD